MKRVALFERVSTEEQAKYGFSIQTQIDALEEYCNTNNYKVIDHYTDDGVSAGKPWRKRPEMKRLIDDVEAGKIDLILFTRLDRWFRNVQEYFKVQEILDKNNVQWKAIWEDYDTTSANGRMAITIFLAINQNEREKTSERITVVFKNKVKNGEACFGGSVKPLGYMKQTIDGVTRLVKDPAEEAMMNDFWETLTTTHNFSYTVRKMGEVWGIHREQKTWQRITKNTFYCGQYKGNPNFCEPYVTPEAFKAFHDSRPIRKTAKKRIYLFAGLIKCPKCGSVMCGNTDVHGDQQWKSYRCRIRALGCGNHSSYSERKIEKELLQRMNEFLKDTITTAEVEASKPKPKPKTDIAKLKERARRLDVVYMNGNMDDEEYKSLSTSIKEQIKAAESEESPEVKDITPLKELLEVDFISIYSTLSEFEKQQFWHNLISEIEIDGRNIKSVKFF